jgi:hypothetical protein
MFEQKQFGQLAVTPIKHTDTARHQNRFGPTSLGKTVMALVNALQNNPPEASHPQGGETASRIMKIRSIWPFPVKGHQTTDDADAESAQQEAGESVTPSSFVT